MRRWVNGWVVAVTLLGVTAYCLAEELTLTTYYPSPRGVYQELRVGSGGPFPSPTGSLHVLKSADDGNAAFRVDDADNDDSPFLVDQNGNVGIGTANPSSLLTVSGVNPALTISATNAGGAQKLVLTDADNDVYSIGRDNASGFLDFKGTQPGYSGYKWYVNTGTEVMRITNGGNVGIGTTDPSHKLDVNGNVEINNQLWLMNGPHYCYLFTNQANCNAGQQQIGSILNNMVLCMACAE